VRWSGLSDPPRILLAMGKNNQQRRAARRRLRATGRVAGTWGQQSGRSGAPGFRHGEADDAVGDPVAPGRRAAGAGPANAVEDRGAAGPGHTDAGPPDDRGKSEGGARLWARGRPSPADSEAVITELLSAGAALAFGDAADDGRVERVVQALVVSAADGDRPGLAAALATERLLMLAGMLWENGWQPVDLVHIVRRHQPARVVQLAIAVIIEQARLDRAADRAPAEWVSQLCSLGLDPTATGAATNGWLVTAWQSAQGIVVWDGWRDILELIGQCQTLHRLTPLLPAPSEWDRKRAAVSGARTRRVSPAGDPPGAHDPRMLGRIRALLSKAEATTFEEEAAAFTAKAQDLMTRYAIDEALLEDSEGLGEVRSQRVHIDNPYAQAKVQLLSTVGSVNRVRVIWDDHHGMATAVGMVVDLQLVEMLFTSLLVQATRALTEVGNVRTTEAGYRSGRPNRSPSFRRAFLLAYANRIGERLAAAGAKASAEATAGHGAELVPVLARRAASVDTAFDRLFPETREMRAKRVDARGWHAGRAAAERAVFATAQVERG